MAHKTTFYRVYAVMGTLIHPTTDWLICKSDAERIVAGVHPALRPFIVTRER